MRGVKYIAAAMFWMAYNVDAAPQPPISLTSDSVSEVSIAYGIAAYNQGDYPAARKLFNAALKSDPDNGTGYYWRGRAKLRMGDARSAAADIEASRIAKHAPDIRESRLLTDLASAQIELRQAGKAEANLKRALELDPNDPTARYLHGVALGLQGQVAQGLSEAEQGIKQDPSLPALPAQSVVPGTGELVKEVKLPFFEIRGSADYGYDSNPAGLPGGVRLTDPGDPSQRFKKADGFGTGTLRTEIHPFYDLNGWSLGLRSDVFRSWYNDLDQFDFSRYAGVVQLAYGKDPLGYLTGPLGYTRVPQADQRWSLLFQAGTAYGSLDGESQSHVSDAAATLKFWETSRTATQFEFDYEDLTFYARDAYAGADGLSGRDLLFRGSQFFYFGKRDRYVRVLAEGGVVDRDDPTYDSHFYGTGVEVSWPLRRGLYLQFLGSYRHEDFDLDVGSHIHDENSFNTTAALVWSVMNHVYVTARSSFFERDANPGATGDLRSFDRAIGTLGITFYY